MVALRAGRGIGSLAIHSALDELRSGRLVRALPGYRLQLLDVCAIHVSRQFTGAKVRIFLDHLRSTLPPAPSADEQALEALDAMAMQARSEVWQAAAHPPFSVGSCHVEEGKMNVRSMIVVAGVAMASSLACYAQSAAPDTAAPGAQAAQAAPAQASPKAAKKAERAANRAFAKKVRLAVMKSPGIGDAQVTVFAKAKTGEVTLAGVITDQSQDRAAVEAARGVQGVTSVTSKLGLRLEGGQ